ncbi:MAG TPA: glycoside hydrolase family 2 TIM barrel-domain containing protein [Tepidisphaeraceae bacterium]|nr:glycoside hydrolase family 2 TIM barrel-domain containing protein [Tepidisphaeraceae bacterium]
MGRSPSDLKQGAWQGKLRGKRKSLPIKKQIGEPVVAPARMPGESPRLTLPLNQDWFFRRLDGTEAGELPVWNGDAAPADVQSWESVNLPHSVRLEPLNASGGRNFQGVCWYCRKLDLPGEWKGKTIHLHFEGAMQVAEVWLNDRKLATNHCGYLPFVIDLTPVVDFGSGLNILAVRLDNQDDPQVPPGKPQRELDFTYFGGLYRNVKLQVMDRLHIVDPILGEKIGGGGVFVTFPSVTPRAANVQIRTNVQNESSQPRQCTVLQELMDPSGQVVARATDAVALAAGADWIFSQTLQVSRPRLWHPHHPHLYTLRTTVLSGDQPGDDRPADEIVTRIGIRHIRFDRRDGLFINGEKFVSIGANRHQDHPYVGYAMPDSGQYRDVKKLREAGFTSFRSHYPQSPAFMDACDELGMLAIVSNPGWQFVGGKIFQAQAIHNARMMVRRDRNHPSVILWEGALNESDNNVLALALQRALHEEYPGDQCFTTGDHEKGIDGAAAIGWDVEYLHNDGSKPCWIREWGDHVDNWTDQQSRSRVPRGWGETPMLIQARSHAARLDEILSGRCTNAPGHDVKRLCGACLWAGIDCQRGYHHQPFYGGVLDLFRLPKFNHFFFQSQRPPEVHVPGLDDGPMIFVANFATFLSPTTVTVFSNCQEVRLLLDGKEIGRKRPDPQFAIAHPPFTFEVKCFAAEQSTMYMTGVAKVEKPPLELLAQGLIDGEVAATHVLHPPGVATKLILQPDWCGRPLTADGSDWLRVYAKVCDARGTVCPFADDLIEFSVQGDGRLIGNAQIGANPIRAEAGIATALVQANCHPGKLIVNATAFGLAAGQAEIASVDPKASIASILQPGF